MLVKDFHVAEEFMYSFQISSARCIDCSAYIRDEWPPKSGNSENGDAGEIRDFELIGFLCREKTRTQGISGKRNHLFARASSDMSRTLQIGRRSSVLP
jgi:hypothetical protein